MVVVHGRGRAERGWFVSSGRFEPLLVHLNVDGISRRALVLGPQMPLLEAYTVQVLRVGRAHPKGQKGRVGKFPTPPFHIARDAEYIARGT